MKIDYETGESEADSSVQVTTENSKASQKYHTNQNSSNNSKNYSSNKNTTAAKQIQKQLLHRKSVETADQRYTTAQVKEIMTVWEHQNILVTFKSEKEAKAAGYHKAQKIKERVNDP